MNMAVDRAREWKLVKTEDAQFLIPTSKEAKVKYYIDEAKKAEMKNDLNGCKSWLLTGVSIVPDSYELQYHVYMFEKRLRNIPEIAWHFETMYRKFPDQMESELAAMADAVRNLHMSKAEELGDDQKFLISVFNELPKNFQMEVLLNRTEKTAAHYEKCQIMLLLVKLFPDTVSQHGVDLLFNLIGYDSDVYSIFRKLLVTELIPAVLNIRKDWNSSKQSQIYQILNQCIEYYVMIPEKEHNTTVERWTKLFKLVDQIGVMLRWKISPFFQEYSGPGSIEMLYKKLTAAFADKNGRAPNELAYTAVAFFLMCVTCYNELRYESGPDKFGEKKKKLVLVEVFTPCPRNAVTESSLPVLLTSSHNSAIHINETHLMLYFMTATKIWQMINVIKGQEEKEFFTILYTMKSLDFENWQLFQDFSIDYRTYMGQNYVPEAVAIKNSCQLASFHCALGNSKLAAEYAVKAACEIAQSDTGMEKDEKKSMEALITEDSNVTGDNHREELSFFDRHLYSTDSKGNFIPQRRVHFVSDSATEVVAYSSNVLIKCFNELLEDGAYDDLCIGHLLTLIQLEWPSRPVERIFMQILDIIRRKGSFRYSPYFGDFIIEPDFLEEFMSIANNDSKSIILDIWPTHSGAVTGSSRRMATRGVDKGAKNDFRMSMKRQMMKNSQVTLDKVILRFLSHHKFDILGCFDQPISFKKHM